MPLRKGSAVKDEFRCRTGCNVLKPSLGRDKLLAVCAAVKGLSLAYVVLKRCMPADHPHSPSPPGWAALFHAEDPRGSTAAGPLSYHFLQNRWGWLLCSTLHKGSCSCQSKCCSSETPYFTYQTLRGINLLLLSVNLLLQLKISSCSYSHVYFRCWDLSIFS